MTTNNIIIPPNIFQTWHTKILPPLMYNAIKTIKLENPEFKYFLFDDNECREFISKYYSKEILNAYDSLIPGAYKADLWRYCVLHKFGGIYLDVKYVPTNFKLKFLLYKEHLVLDMPNPYGPGIYNAMMVCKPESRYLMDAINKIVENVKTRFYGKYVLEPTGPQLLSKIIDMSDKELIDCNHQEIGNSDGKVILYKNRVIFKSYKGHINERNRYSKIIHYAVLWNQRKIYK